MKEATGELNMAVVILIAVGILAAFFYYTIWPMITNNMNRNSRCSDAICVCPKDKTEECLKNGADCYMKGDKDNSDRHFTCAWKG